jgi:hypothetical protein
MLAENKNRFIRQKRLSLSRVILWHGCGVFVNRLVYKVPQGSLLIFLRTESPYIHAR